MTAKALARPPYILAHPGDTAGCGFYRIIKPIEALTKAGYATARIELQFIPTDVLTAMEPDVVVWQRQNEASQIEIMRAYREALPNAFFVYEIDDALGSIPEASFHQPFMSPTIDDRVPRAAAICDVITVTTQPLKAHMEQLCPGIEVRIVPNMLTKADVATAKEIRAKLSPHSSKIRVGWGGGMGHAGDLALLNEAFIALKDEVEWVFIGFHPEMPEGVDWRFVNSVAPNDYIAALAGLDVDMLVAPLEENHFNACKSNLRLVEAGCCGYPVIATPFGPYVDKQPPVAYAHTPADWAEQIRKLAAMTPGGRIARGEALRKWVLRDFILDDHFAERIRQWLPSDVTPFVPNTRVGNGTVIARGSHRLRVECEQSNFDVIYARDGAIISDQALNAFGTRTRSDKQATISVVSNDGGPAGFPEAQNFVRMNQDFADGVALICSEIGGTAQMVVSAGPVLLLTRRAMNLIGLPDFDRYPMYPELALLEWSLEAAAHGFTNTVDLSTFVLVEKQETVPAELLNHTSMRLSSRWPIHQGDDPVLAAFRESVELRFHRGNYRHIPPRDRGDYALWTKQHDTLGNAGMEAAFKWYVGTSKPPIDVIFYDDAPLTSDMLDPPEGESPLGRWKLLMPKGATPAMTVIAHCVEAIERHPDALAFYGDHDYAPEGVRGFHDFKPNLDIHLLLGRDYVSQVMLVRNDSNQGLRGFRQDLPASCQLYNMALHFSDHSFAVRPAVVHIPRIMAHLPAPVAEVQERYARINAEIVNRVARWKGWPVVAKQHPDLKNYQAVKYISDATPRVAIIIPTNDNPEMLTPCLNTVLKMTRYPNFEVIVVDNSPTGSLADHPDPRVKVFHFNRPFNWSEINNYAATTITDASVLCFLNDDTRVLEPNWLTEMVAASAFPRVGVVGAKLSYPSGAVQHVGVVSAYGDSGHVHLGMPLQYAGYNGIAALNHEATAVTGACMLVTREVFTKLGGFDESFGGNFNDVAFCLESIKAGLVNVVVVGAHLQHIASATRRSVTLTPEAIASAQAETQRMRSMYQDPDPYWNPNLMFAASPNGLSAVGVHMDTLSWPPEPNPWESNQYARILVVGPKESATAEARDREAIYQLIVQGNMAQIVDPPMPNVRPFDLRDPDTASQALQQLGIDKIVVSALENGSTLLLSFLTRLSIPVEYRPRTAESVCPRRNLRPNGAACDKGWTKPGECQACIDINGSPNGYVTIDAWRADWRRFITRSNVSVQLEFLEVPDYGDAIGYVFGGGGLEDIPAT